MPPPLLRLPILPRLRRLDRLRQWRLVLALAISLEELAELERSLLGVLGIGFA